MKRRTVKKILNRLFRTRRDHKNWQKFYDRAYRECSDLRVLNKVSIKLENRLWMTIGTEEQRNRGSGNGCKPK